MTVVGRPEITKRANFALGTLSQSARRVFLRRSTRQSTILPRIAEVLLLVIFSILLALICLRIFSPLPLPAGTPVVAENHENISTVDVAVVNPFPVSEVVPVVIKETPEVVDTTLDVTLTGVWVVADGGSATIETSDGNQSRFSVGDEIIDGVTLESVFADQVIINRNGAREALRFESKLAVPSSVPSAPAERNLAVPKDDVVATIADFLRLAPATDEDGNFAVEIYATRDRQKFNQYGFQDGDRVVSINGTPPPASQSALLAMIGALQRNSEAVIVVSRNGREIPVSLSLDGERTQ